MQLVGRGRRRAKGKAELAERAAAIETFERRVSHQDRVGASVLVSGVGAMDNMKPRDFVLSRQPLRSMGGDTTVTLQAMVEAAGDFGAALRTALKPIAGEGVALEALRETYFIETQAGFEACMDALLRGDPPVGVAADWVRKMEAVGLSLFDRSALPGIERRKPRQMAEIVDAREALRGSFAGWRRPGREAYAKLGLPPETSKAAA